MSKRPTLKKSVKKDLPLSNSIIEQLPKRSRARLIEACSRVHLHMGEILVDARHPFSQVYFPLHGFISLVAAVPGHKPIEIGLIGNEGMLGATLALRVREAPIRAIVQGAGSALCMPVAAFARELEDNLELDRALCRYIHISIAHMARSSVCARFHEIEPRLAKWLLMSHDRAYADVFHYTHDYLASMLGVRRSGISVAANRMQRKKVIRYHRGEIVVLDRRALEGMACDCYAEHSKDFFSQVA